MDVVELLINVMGPVVVIVGLGWFAGTRMDFDVATLSRLAFWVLGPIFVLDVFADAELDSSTVVKLTIGGLGAMAVGAVLVYALAKGMNVPASRTKAAVMTGSYGNVGNAGLAICAFAFGEEAIPAAAVLMIVVNTTGIFLGVALASAQTAGFASAMKRSLLTPMTIAAIVAMGLNAVGWDFPVVLDRSISIAGGALIPVMLITLGLQLAGDIRPEISADSGIVVGTKLMVVPLAAALFGWLLGLEGDDLGVLVIQSCMPPAVFTAVVALEFNLEPERVTKTVLGTTLVALLTIPIALIAVT